jgi:hypothetical protein
MHVRARLTRKRVRGRLCPAGPIDPKTKKPTGRHFKFRVKSGQVVKGWDDGISQLSLGEKARITIPSGERDFNFLPFVCCADATVLCTFRVRDCALAMCICFSVHASGGTSRTCTLCPVQAWPPM